MVQLVMLVAVVGSLGGCVLDRSAADRPAHFALGLNSRQLTTVPTTPSATPGVAQRTTQPTGGQPAETRFSAVTGSAQFTMALRSHAYLGGEVEAGSLGTVGSNFAGAYGIGGFEESGRRGSLALELAIGARQLSFDVTSPSVTTTIIEPRLRAQVWLSDQFTLGAAIGADPGDHAWMAGLSLSVYSTMFNSWK